MKRTKFTVGVVFALTFFLVGCGPKDSHFQDIRQAALDGNETLNTKIELSLGIVPLWMAETITAFIDEPEVQEARTYLDHVNRVEVGVYEAQDAFQHDRATAAQRVKSSMMTHGFEPLVLVKEKRESVGVYVPKVESEFPKELFVVVMAEHEVVLVRIEGQLDKIIKAAAKNHMHEIPNFNKFFKEQIVL